MSMFSPADAVTAGEFVLSAQLTLITLISDGSGAVRGAGSATHKGACLVGFFGGNLPALGVRVPAAAHRPDRIFDWVGVSGNQYGRHFSILSSGPIRVGSGFAAFARRLGISRLN
jgi:hypothetical protein